MKHVLITILLTAATCYGQSMAAHHRAAAAQTVASAASFSPSDLGTRLKLWLDSSDGSTVFESISPDVLATNGGYVTQWRDKTTNAIHFGQSTLAQKPKYYTGIQNGRAVLRCNGDDQLVSGGTASPLNNVAAAYLWAVAKDGNPTGGDTAHILVRFQGGGAAARVYLLTRGSSTAGHNVGGRRLDADSDVSTTRDTSSTTGYNVLVAFMDFGNGYLRHSLNGGSYESVAYSSGAGNSENTSGGGSLFRFNTNTEMPANSEIAEVICVVGSMTAGEISNVNAYLKAKWTTP
jgi:hypothetical protein